jgi:hypothetical protein
MTSVIGRSHYGANCNKLVGFREQKLLCLKTARLALISPLCKQTTTNSLAYSRMQLMTDI